MAQRESERNPREWQDGMPAEDGLYEYRGPLYTIDSDEVVRCDPSCRVNLRTGDGLRISLQGEEGQEYDATRTGDGRWRGPIGPVRIPLEDARTANE